MTEPTDHLRIAGRAADHPRARDLARVVHAIHQRYAREVVGAYELCPHMKDPRKAFGHFCVMLDVGEPDLAAAVAEVLAAKGEVCHLVYPLISMPALRFERFGGRIHDAVEAEMGRDAPVHATFHPEMDGGGENASRLVGLVRRAPDPFVQFVPEGLQGGGTQYVDLDSIDWSQIKPPEAPRNEQTYERLGEEGRRAIAERVATLRRARDEAYAELIDALLRD